MKKGVLAPFVLFILSILINSVNAEGDSFTDKFLGSPLIVLVAIIVIDIIAFIFHKIRR
ncbi:MAG: hypothetical protein OEZ21_04030 [Candidatus Bathyarchaeota archaeon]|jgi:hypothetical protein|nr:hypothetical protein [Candidatus Bathyarchaeota archaeon]MDH5746111.1 hypothetical protein [Candidatus Bathyarchaeota archaeon]